MIMDKSIYKNVDKQFAEDLCCIIEDFEKQCNKFAPVNIIVEVIMLNCNAIYLLCFFWSINKAYNKQEKIVVYTKAIQKIDIKSNTFKEILEDYKKKTIKMFENWRFDYD